MHLESYSSLASSKRKAADRITWAAPCNGHGCGTSVFRSVTWKGSPDEMREQSILLVEDEEAMRMVLSDRLRLEGYAVDSATDKESGFAKATSLSFDLMILDVMLPGRNGFDLCRDIRRAGLATPILFLSALREPSDTVAGLGAGADAYITKPFDMGELSARVEALLRRSQARSAPTQHLRSQPTTFDHPHKKTRIVTKSHPGKSVSVPNTQLTHDFYTEVERRV